MQKKGIEPVTSSWALSRHLKRVTSEGPFRAFSYYIFTVGFEKLGIHYSHSFQFADGVQLNAPSPQVSFAILEGMQDMTPTDRDTVIAYAGEQYLRHYEASFAAGEKCVVARWLGRELACACWLTRAHGYFLAPDESSWLIERCFTTPNHRGKGIYPQVLGFACAYVRKNSEVDAKIFIECKAFNFGSTRGICKAGFILVGKMLSIHHWHWRWPVISGRTEAVPR